MVDNSKEVRRQILDVIGCIAAAITIVVYLVLCIDAQWAFIPRDTTVYKVLLIIKTWAPLIVVAIVGWEFVADKNIIWRIIFYAAVALVVIFMFFPGTWDQLVGLVDKNA